MRYKIKSSQSGLAPFIIIAIVGVLLVGGGAATYVAMQQNSEEGATEENLADEEGTAQNEGEEQRNQESESLTEDVSDQIKETVEDAMEDTDESAEEETEEVALQRTTTSCRGSLFETHAHVHPNEFGAPVPVADLINRMDENGARCGVLFMDRNDINNNFASIQETLADTGIGIIPFAAPSISVSMTDIHANNSDVVRGLGEVVYYSGPLQGTSLHDPSSAEMFEYANREGLFVMIHPTEVQADELPEVLSQYPNAKFLLHGFELVDNVSRNFLPNLLSEHNNVYWSHDLSQVIGPHLYSKGSAEAFVNWWNNQAPQGQLISKAQNDLARLMNAAPDRIMWGTDLGVAHNTDPRVYSIYMDITNQLVNSLPASQQAAYSYQNAARVFGPAITFERQ